MSPVPALLQHDVRLPFGSAENKSEQEQHQTANAKRICIKDDDAILID